MRWLYIAKRKIRIHSHISERKTEGKKKCQKYKREIDSALQNCIQILRRPKNNLNRSTLAPSTSRVTDGWFTLLKRIEKRVISVMLIGLSVLRVIHVVIPFIKETSLALWVWAKFASTARENREFVLILTVECVNRRTETSPVEWVLFTRRVTSTGSWKISNAVYLLAVLRVCAR